MAKRAIRRRSINGGGYRKRQRSIVVAAYGAGEHSAAPIGDVSAQRNGWRKRYGMRKRGCMTLQQQRKSINSRNRRDMAAAAKIGSQQRA